MKQKPLQSILFTHIDLDAAGCRILYELAHWYMQKGRDYIIVECSNEGIDPTVEKMINSEILSPRTEICFADICPNEELLTRVYNQYNVVRVWDHHTSRPWLMQYPNAILIDQNDLGVLQSATSILFQWYCGQAFQHPSDPMARYFHKEGNQVLLSRLVDAIRSYDTYEWKITGTIMPKKLQTLWFMLGMDRFCDRYIQRITNDLQNNELISPHDMEFVDGRLDAEQRAIDGFTPDTVYTMQVRGYTTAFVVHTHGANISELANQFLRKYPEYDIFIGFNIAGPHFSIRTVRDDINVATDVAGPIGGGGHAKAAGATISRAAMNHIIKVLWRQLNKKEQVEPREFRERVNMIQMPKEQYR